MEEIKKLNLGEEELKEQKILLSQIASLTSGNFEFSALRSKTQNIEYLGKLWLTNKELIFKGYKVLELSPLREPVKDIVCKFGDPFKSSITLPNVEKIFTGHDETFGRRHQIYPKLKITSKSDNFYFILFKEDLISTKEEVFEISKKWQSKIEEVTKEAPKVAVAPINAVPKPKLITPIEKTSPTPEISSPTKITQITTTETSVSAPIEVATPTPTEIPQHIAKPVPKPVVAVPKKKGKSAKEVKPVLEAKPIIEAKPVIEEPKTAELPKTKVEPVTEKVTEEINEDLLPNIAKLKQKSAAKSPVSEAVTTTAASVIQPKPTKKALKEKESEKLAPKVEVKPKSKEKTATEMLREEEARLKPKFKITTVKPYQSEISTKYTPLKATMKPISVKDIDESSAVDKVIGDIREEMDIEVLSTEMDSMTADTSINKCPNCGWLLAWNVHKCPKCKKEV